MGNGEEGKKVEKEGEKGVTGRAFCSAYAPRLTRALRTLKQHGVDGTTVAAASAAAATADYSRSRLTGVTGVRCTAGAEGCRRKFKFKLRCCYTM